MMNEYAKAPGEKSASKEFLCADFYVKIDATSCTVQLFAFDVCFEFRKVSLSNGNWRKAEPRKTQFCE